MEPVTEGFAGITILEQTAGVLRGMLAGATTDDRAWQPSPERWSIDMVLAHLADVELNAFGRRFRAMAEGDTPPLPVYDQEGFFNSRQKFDGLKELETFDQRRRDTLAWLKSLPDSVKERGGRHGELGLITFDELLHEFAFHDLGHIRQIAELLRARVYYPRIGAFQKYFQVKP